MSRIRSKPPVIVAALAGLTVIAGASTAWAQSPAGSPSDPTTNENQQPGPNVANPTDPAAGADPAAREPTSPPGTGSGSSAASGEGSGGFESPAGNPSDPTTEENQQPGPSVANPADPGAGSNPEDRVPTDGTAR